MLATQRCRGFLVGVLGLVGVTGCATPEPTNGIWEDREDLSEPSGGDLAPAPVGDSLPKGSISFYNRRDCPTGWAPFALAKGRTLVPAVGIATVGTTAGTPLDDAEDRKHGHTISASINPPGVNYAGIVGGGNTGVARSGMTTLTVASGTASAGIPYVQLLVCEKMEAADRSQRPAPVGLHVYFALSECPEGWTDSGLPAGRFLVGLPTGGKPGQTFGAKALTAMAKPTHQHGVKGAIKTTSHGIALASGGAAGGYAKNDTYSYQVLTDEESAQFPHLMLLQCKKL